MMKCNVGSLDRIVRIVLAVFFAALVATETVKGTAAIVLGVLAGVFLLTAIVRFCPLYVPFKIDTKKK